MEPTEFNPDDPMAIVESELPAVPQVQAALPADLEALSTAQVISFAQSLGRLNVQLTTAFNEVIRVATLFAPILTGIVDEYAALAERLEAEEQAAAESSHEASAAADWPGGVRPESLGGSFPHEDWEERERRTAQLVADVAADNLHEAQQALSEGGFVVPAAAGYEGFPLAEHLHGVESDAIGRALDEVGQAAAEARGWSDGSPYSAGPSFRPGESTTVGEAIREGLANERGKR